MQRNKDCPLPPQWNRSKYIYKRHGLYHSKKLGIPAGSHKYFCRFLTSFWDKAGELAVPGWATDTAWQLSQADGAVTGGPCPLHLRLSRGLLVWDGWLREKRSIAHLSAFLLVLRRKRKTDDKQSLSSFHLSSAMPWPVVFCCDTVILRVALPGPFHLPPAAPSDWLQRGQRPSTGPGRGGWAPAPFLRHSAFGALLCKISYLSRLR